MTKTFGKDFDKLIGKRAEIASAPGKDTFLEKTLGKLFNKGEPMEFFTKQGSFTKTISDAAASRTATRELEKIKALSESFGGMFSDKIPDTRMTELETIAGNSNKGGTLTFLVYRSIRGNN
jgi:hypothetical protein